MAGNQAHLDALAQRLGYRDYATYSAYQAHQAAMRQQNGIQGTGYSTGPQDQPAPPPENWLQRLISNYTPLGAVAKRINQVLP